MSVITLPSTPVTFTINTLGTGQALLFAIPAGTWTSARLLTTGTWTVIGVGAGSWQINTPTAQTPAGHSGSGTYTDATALSAGVLADVVAAAGASLSMTVSTSSALAYASIAFSSFVLELTGTLAADHCGLSPASQTTVIDIATGAYTVTLYDSLSAPIAAPIGGQAFTLSDGGGGTFSTGTMVTVAAGSSSVTFTYSNHTPGTYTLTATPGTGPLSGRAACQSAEAIVMPAGLTINNLLSVLQPGLTPTLYVCRSDQTNIAVFDVLTDGVSVANAVYQTHPAVLADQNGSPVRLRCTQVRVFGTGTITSGTLTVRPDTNDSRAKVVDATLCVPASGQWERNEQVLFLYEPPQEMVGWCFDAAMNVTGTGIVFKDVQFECEVV